MVLNLLLITSFHMLNIKNSSFSHATLINGQNTKILYVIDYNGQFLLIHITWMSLSLPIYTKHYLRRYRYFPILFRKMSIYRRICQISDHHHQS